MLSDGQGALLEGLPEHLARDPRRFAGSVTNALYNLETTPGARPGEWVESMLRLGRIAPDVAALLDTGKVAAWRAGMAHFRAGALETCAALPPDLARAVLGAAPGTEPRSAVNCSSTSKPPVRPVWSTSGRSRNSASVRTNSAREVPPPRKLALSGP